MSDNERVCAALSESKQLRNDIKHLLTVCQQNAVNFESIHVRNSRLWIEVSPKDQKNPIPTTSFAKAIVPILYSISTVLTERLYGQRNLKEPFLAKAALLLAISTSMALVGGINLFHLQFVRVPFILYKGALFAMSLLTGLIVIGLLVTATFVFLGRKARTHLILIELVLVGYFGAVGTSFTLMRSMNIEFDAKPGQTHLVKVQNARVETRRGRRGRRTKSYHLYVNDWLKEGETRKIQVSSSLYNSKRIGSTLEITQKPGFLGFEWVSSMH
jgi:hypothetical protein